MDEATSLSWNLSLLARWEGNAWAISVIEKHLWPFLQKWSSGLGSNAAAAAAISCIGTIIITLLFLFSICNFSRVFNAGMLAKYVTAQQRNGIKSVLEALKAILQAGEGMPL